ncbi:hypothetical protein EIKCOROL_00210 [Eikenella corrodens ATCC 23834]|uniref:Uncharacterized protein n=1 Tax=Eikenella corrodens ATCC 23834 TaxID=546274 RepID=C0DS88_EIKCO|nr:hypothetical protein EIKCOROL_00210 [Eikenella corrodens ATCC 23834]
MGGYLKIIRDDTAFAVDSGKLDKLQLSSRYTSHLRELTTCYLKTDKNKPTPATAWHLLHDGSAHRKRLPESFR